MCMSTFFISRVIVLCQISYVIVCLHLIILESTVKFSAMRDIAKQCCVSPICMGADDNVGNLGRWRMISTF